MDSHGCTFAKKKRCSILPNILQSLWQISSQHFKRHRTKGEKRGRTHETAVKRRALISWPSSMDEFHTRLKTCPPKRERNLSPCSRIKPFFERTLERVKYTRSSKKKRKKEEKRKRGWYVSRGAPVLKKRGQKSRGTSHEAGLYRSPRSCVGGNARGGMKRRGGVGRRVAHRLVQGSTDITLHPQPNRRGNRKGE